VDAWRATRKVFEALAVLGGVNWGEPASLSAGLAVEVNNTDRAPIPADRRKGRLVGNTVTDRVLTDNGVAARAG